MLSSQVEGLYVRQSGAPLDFGNIIFSGDIENIAFPAGRQTADRWFNTEAGFVRDSALTLAYNVRTFPLRFSGVRGPAINNFDLSALKNSALADPGNLAVSSRVSQRLQSRLVLESQHHAHQQHLRRDQFGSRQHAAHSTRLEAALLA
jgi:hypothetical protein